MTWLPWAWSAAVGCVTGILSGFGIGGGTLLVLYLTFLAGMDQKQAQGINLVYFVFAGLPAAWMHAKNRRVKIRPAVWASGAGILAAAASSFAAARMETDLLRRLFGALLLYVGVKELFFTPRPDAAEDNRDNAAK